MRATNRRLPPRIPRRERGLVLIIAMVVLVAMTLAGIAMMRSVDTAAVVAGNISFRQASVNAADQGLQVGYAWLSTATGTQLQNDNAAVGYYSSVVDAVFEVDWFATATWAGALALNSGNPDAGGNVVSVIIQRMCPCANTPPGDACAGGGTNTCGTTPDTSLLTGEGVDTSAPNFFTKPPSLHYRITARSVGPRNSISVVQTMVRAK